MVFPKVHKDGWVDGCKGRSLNGYPTKYTLLCSLAPCDENDPGWRLAVTKQVSDLRMFPICSVALLLPGVSVNV